MDENYLGRGCSFCYHAFVLGEEGWVLFTTDNSEDLVCPTCAKVHVKQSV